MPGASKTHKTSRGRALPISEAGMRTLATQINAILATADPAALAVDLDLEGYTRLATVLVRLVEAGVKCEKHRRDEQLESSKTGLGTEGLEEIETKLHLL